MALHFSKEKTLCVPDWKGNLEVSKEEQISCMKHAITVGDMFTIQRDTQLPIMGGLDIEMDNIESLDKYWDMMKMVLGKYTSDWKNIIVDDVEITEASAVLDTLQLQHMDLLAVIFNEVVASASVTEEEAKNSDGQLDLKKTDSDLIAEPALTKDSKPLEIVEGTT